MAIKQLNSENVNEGIIVMCACCSAVKINLGWLPYNWARFLIDIQKIEAEMRISHGICKSCAVKVYGPDAAHLFDNQKKDNVVTI